MWFPKSFFHMPLCLVVTLCSTGVARGEDLDWPEKFADRWVKYTQDGDRSGIPGLLAPDAVLTFEAGGRQREVNPYRYAKLVSIAIGNVDDLQRERGEVELDDEGALVRLFFEITDRMETPLGFTIESVTREKFEFSPKDLTRAVKYSSRTLSCETITRPESWRTYGGPLGVNGYILEAHATAAPEGMGKLIAGIVVALILFLMFLYSTGLKRRL